MQAFVSAFFAILFLQSGLDKVIDRKGNLEWLAGHFSKTFLKGTVPLMVTTVTIVELAAGGLSVIGVIEAVFFKASFVSLLQELFSASLAFIMLFFGQRIAKDYAGAATLASYFIIVVVDLYFLA